MKKRLRSNLVAIIATMLLAVGNCWAAKSNTNKAAPSICSGTSPTAMCRKAPEIDTGAGGRAIVLIVTALLLVSQKRNRSI